MNGRVAADEWPEGSDDAAVDDELPATVLGVAVDVEVVAGDVVLDELCVLGLELELELELELGLWRGLGGGVEWEPVDVFGVVELPSGSTYC